MAIVDILLASYNGARYIETQILSIISQSFTDWRLLVHDDGSNDNTVEIARKLSEYDHRIEIIEDGVKCGGAAANFMHLTRFATAQFVMFCDQDDIWFDNKIELMVGVIQKYQNNVPAVVYSNSYVWKPNKGCVGLATLTFPRNLKQFLFLNSGMQGSVAIFNRAMCQILSSWHGQCTMHDHLLHLAGLTMGKVEYFDLPLMLYRNHDQNVTGDTATSTMEIGRIVNNKSIPVVDIKHYKSIVDFFEKYKKKLSQNDQHTVLTYIKMKNMTMFGRLLHVLIKEFCIFDSRIRLMIKIILRPYIN